MHVKLEGRIVIVTGAAQGIGRAVAVRAAQAGAAGLLLTDRQRADDAVAEVEAAGAPCAFVQADLAEPAAAAGIVAACAERFGSVDGLVNAAGVTDRASVLQADAETFDQLFAINTRAPLLLMRESIRAMRGRGAGGVIVNILSINAHGGSADLALYAASKAALALITRNAAHAHRFDRIRVNGVNVGWTDTPGERATQAGLGRSAAWLADRAAEQPFGRLLDPDDVARLVLFLLADASHPTTGAIVDQEQWAPGVRD
ncbi:MAG TPA: oxidoreductase [Caulobacteraceae bacterium]|nr:oxidoreductase [Caulobacteraceae bacterium]